MDKATVIASEQRERGNPAYLRAVLPGWIASVARLLRNDDGMIS